MTRLISGALALACALALGACNVSDLSALQGVTPNLPPTTVTGQVLSDAGLTPAAQATVQSNIAKVQTAAAKLCTFRPLAAGILNVAIAASTSVATVANSAAGQGVRGVATIICNGLTTAPAYTALGDREGELVTAYIRVGQFDRVPVYGIRTR
jgi:hypothetical protein